jgi:hypothetical protein
MKIMIIFFTALFSTTVFAGERLNSQQLKEFFTNKTIIGQHKKFDGIKTYFAADGTVHSITQYGKERMGKWWIEEKNNTRCIKWHHKNKNFCHYAIKNDDGTYKIQHSIKDITIVNITSIKEGKHLN